MNFAELGLSERTLKALEHAGFEAPTPIQARAIPPALAGGDVIGCAATGTGKTAAFLLPILERLTKAAAEAAPAHGPAHGHGHGHGRAARRGPRALVLAPTRELAMQIQVEAARFSEGRPVRSAVVIGGVGMNPQADAFRTGVEIIVATPGRLNDHLDRGSARLDDVEVLVLDEADRMLDMGFKPQLDRILQRVPKKRQTLLFSATMAGEVADFAARHLHQPARFEVARSGTTSERATQQVFLVGQEEKLALLLALLEEDQLSTLVFTRTKRRADRVAKALAKAGHEVAVIHADRSQGQRKAALDAFRAGEARVLVATDIAARGIDVAEIGHVINFDLPHVAEDYVHRIGRTARAEASGRASSFAAPEEHDLLRGIEKLTRKSVERAKVPRESATFQSAVERHVAAAQTHRQHAMPRAPGGERPHKAARPHNPSRPHGSQRNSRPSSGGRGQHKEGASQGKSLGTWKPRRRR